MGLFNRAVIVAAVLTSSGAALAQDGCQHVKMTCSEAKQQNIDYCASERRVQTGMTYDGCIKSGERAMQECLKTGRWITGRRNLCDLTKR